MPNVLSATVALVLALGCSLPFGAMMGGGYVRYPARIS